MNKLSLSWQGDNLMLGNLYVGEIITFRSPRNAETPYRGWLMCKDNDGEEVGWYATEVEAKTAVEAALWVAIGIMEEPK